MRWRYLILLGLAVVVAFTLLWTGWTEQHPETERELRIQLQEQLEEWFPEGMSLPDELVGFIPRSERFESDDPPRVLLLHGLDEPGGIWDELIEALDEAGINAWEFRYPNDQAIDHSTDLLAEYWPKLDQDQAIVLLGHSMGGLVIRDFLTRWRHLTDGEPSVTGARVDGVILVGTPNQGSDWARLRVWLELRELVSDIAEQRFSPFFGLRDGTGAAKIDLRPDSQFLAELNDRPWPESVPVRIIGGALTEPDDDTLERIELLASDLDAPELADELGNWWQQAGEGLGDGVVPVASLPFEGAPEPVIVEASHRGLLLTLPLSEPPPPAIAPILDWLAEWSQD
jgi:pimeloyl-ACP methyl ester carboxylesterase